MPITNLYLSSTASSSSVLVDLSARVATPIEYLPTAGNSGRVTDESPQTSGALVRFKGYAWRATSLGLRRRCMHRIHTLGQ